MPIISRRKYQRAHLIKNIRYHIAGLNDFHSDGVSVDISTEGLGMITNHPLKTGNVLFFEEEFDLKTNNRSIKASIVRWVRTIEKNSYRVGLGFVR